MSENRPLRNSGHEVWRRAVQERLLVSLFCGDAVFILLHVVGKLLGVPYEFLYLQTEGGFAEAFQYIKEYSVAVMLAVFAFRSREWIFLAWGLLFAYLLCDDALSIHEVAGSALSGQWADSAAVGLSPNYFGGLIVSAIVGTAFVLLIGSLYRGASLRGRGASRDLTVLLASLVFFGVGIDMLHIVVEGFPIAGLTIVEDGGEMLAMSLITAYTVRLVEDAGQNAGLIWSWARSQVVRNPDGRGKR